MNIFTIYMLPPTLLPLHRALDETLKGIADKNTVPMVQDDDDKLIEDLQRREEVDRWLDASRIAALNLLTYLSQAEALLPKAENEPSKQS